MTGKQIYKIYESVLLALIVSIIIIHNPLQGYHWDTYSIIGYKQALLSVGAIHTLFSPLFLVIGLITLLLYLLLSQIMKKFIIGLSSKPSKFTRPLITGLSIGLGVTIIFSGISNDYNYKRRITSLEFDPILIGIGVALVVVAILLYNNGGKSNDKQV